MSQVSVYLFINHATLYKRWAPSWTGKLTSVSSCPSSSNSIVYLCHLPLFSVQGERAIKIQWSKRTTYLGRVLAVLFVERLHVIHKLVQAWQTCKWLQLVQHQQLSCYAFTRCFSLCQKKFRSRNKWNAASVRVEIGGPPPKVALFRTNLAVPFPKILVSSPAFQYAKQWSQFRSKRKWIASIRLKILI